MHGAGGDRERVHGYAEFPDICAGDLHRDRMACNLRLLPSFSLSLFLRANIYL
jgi:hypothetical protein